MDTSKYHYRGYLPHWDLANRTQFVTFSLVDSIPARLLRSWYSELEHIPEPSRTRAVGQRVEEMLDKGHGQCLLANPSGLQSLSVRI